MRKEYSNLFSSAKQTGVLINREIVKILKLIKREGGSELEKHLRMITKPQKQVVIKQKTKMHKPGFHIIIKSLKTITDSL